MITAIHHDTPTDAPAVALFRWPPPSRPAGKGRPWPPRPPKGMPTRLHVEAAITALIDLLDAMDGDADCEPDPIEPEEQD